MFKVIGDEGYQSETLLYETDTAEEAERFIHTYTRWGDFGGYSNIIAGYVDADGCFIELLSVDAPEDEE